MNLTIEQLDELVDAAKLDLDAENILVTFIDENPNDWYEYLEFHSQIGTTTSVDFDVENATLVGTAVAWIQQFSKDIC